MANKKILFIFDRVTHYHKDLFLALDKLFSREGNTLALLSGEKLRDDSGRVPLTEKVIANEVKYVFKEYTVGSFTFRRHCGVLSHIKALRPDVVVVQSHVGNITYWQMLMLKKKLGFKLVTWQCGYEYNPGRLKNLLLRNFIPRFDFHLAYHTNAKRYCLRYGSPEEQVVVMHNTINDGKIKLIDKSVAKSSLRIRYPQVADKRIVLFVGAVLQEKKIELVVEALDLLKKENVVFLVVGDGPHLQVLKEQFATRSDVVFAGRVVDGVDAFFAASDIFVLPGTGGLAINEAMVHGLSILSAYADGSADDLVVDGLNGYRLRDDSAEELAKRLRELLDDPEKMGRMGQASKEMILGHFSFDCFIERVYTSISSLV